MAPCNAPEIWLVVAPSFFRPDVLKRRRQLEHARAGRNELENGASMDMMLDGGFEECRLVFGLVATSIQVEFETTQPR